MKHLTTILSDDELELVRGAEDYHFCWTGPAGTGLYPGYVPCGNPFINAIVEGVTQGVKNAGHT